MEILEKFLLFERDNALFKKKIKGIKYWHLVRFNIYYQILRQRNLVSKSFKQKKHGLSYYLKLFKEIKYLFTFPLFGLSKRDILVINSPRRKNNGDYYECIYTDGLLRELDNYSHCVIERSIDREHYVPANTKDLIYLDLIEVSIELYVLFSNLINKVKLTSKEISEIETMISRLNNEFNVSLKSDKVHNLIQSTITRFSAYEWFFNKVLEKVSPEVIIEVVSYITPVFALNHAAKRKGIPSIELQHGTMGKNNVAYNFLIDDKLEMFPDYLFLFGKYWKHITRLPLSRERIKIVGWPFFEEKVKDYKNGHKKIDQTIILFISQEPIGKELSKLAVELSENIDHLKYKIIYKLHPSEYAQWRKDYPWLIESNINVVENDDKDVYFYFSIADIQVGVYSTAIFEGVGFGLKTIIFKTYGHEFMEYLYTNNYAVLVDGFESLIFNIHNLKKPTNIDICYLWQEESMKKLINSIEDIIVSNK